MKYCPYCGAELHSGTVSFCSACGKKLAKHKECPAKKRKSKEPKTKSTPKKQKPKKEPRQKKVRPQKPHKTRAIPEVMGEPVDEGYDGYYNDVLPPDADRISEGMDKNLVIKIVTLFTCVCVIILMCVALLYVL